MKKLFALFTAAAMTLTLAACGTGTASSEPAAEGSGVSGTFEAQAAGQGGEANPVTVRLTLENSVIVGCEAEGPGETDGIGSKAIDSMPGAIAESGSIAVDTVSGATVTSNAILTAAAAALESAGLNPEDYKTAAEGAAAAAPAEDVTKDCDIVIVGAGGAGMTAAIEASDLGHKVIIVESQSMVGGNSVRSTGGMNAAKTVFQDENEFGEEAGVEKTLASADSFTGTNEETVKELAETVK